ncbi:hypothetical protein BDP81DRAFT_315510 [Colletotrichum phormii]|uniref:Uncharacterized protein n=1 Tax=Colletotrichum phormii TaxID=359342 RepID=A0AAJ0EH39_9PEZI|nr:uncharacterized protein BDP81DRAFT_315510 [Colletotrichum phormii]KAK1638604.1 hypothetical protein BDP81DRAFT_315510 [Colletotrichum phormii]
MRSWIRVIFTVTVVGVSVGIIAVFVTSQTQAGIGTPGGYWYLLWTSLPVLTMLGISLYISSSDTASRNLWTLHFLSIKSSSVQQLHFSILDMSGPRAMITALQMRTWSILTSQTLTLLCAFLTAIGSILFTVDWNLVPKDLQLRQNSWFADKTMAQGVPKYDRNVCNLLIGKGEGDFPYPKGTYDNFIFPDMTLPTIPSKNVSFEVEVTAASLEPLCTRVADETGNFRIKEVEHSNERGSWIIYSADIHFDIIMLNGAVIKINESVFVGDNETTATERIFALGDRISTTTRLYLWGSWKLNFEDISFLRTWHCGYSWKKTVMNVDMTVVDNELVIDQSRPPRPVEGTTEPWNPQFSFTNYGSQQDFRPDSSEDRNRTFDMDKEMILALKPYGPLELEALGNSSREDDVKAVVNQNWAFLHTQVANKKNRLSLNESAISVNLPPGGLPPVKAKLTDHSRRRLFQNPVATYLILVILGLVIAVHILMLVPKAVKNRLGWEAELLSMDVEGLAPDGFNSISRMVTLLHSSNAIQYMPSQSLSQDELFEQLEHLRFRLGWFEKQVDKTRHFTIGVEGDAGFVFLGAPREIEVEPKPASPRRYFGWLSCGERAS